MAQWLQLGFQDGASVSQKELIIVHDYIFMILVLITVLFSYIMMSAVLGKYTYRGLSEGQDIEFMWTALPVLLLLFIAFPSLRVLYLLDEVGTPALTVKAVGHQWYWSYEYDGFEWLNFDSYMVPSSSLSEGDFRLLEVDNRVVLPVQSCVRFLISAADVLHSWTVPSLGVKADAIPGRLNQVNFTLNYPGVFYGQCSEICGANHSFMPIVVESVDKSDYVSWCLNSY
uniref:cytochrome c oxidase subunit II n=1 Tax=Epipenaeon fissurae TaxID=2995643 RepID=UPI0022FDAC9E|nr:cytochrome c oxidase subunit II [Epipenaeon fissurae]WBK03020.1 cytochrome c oxidase subunit 2 [Epipenaeon fissurae]